MARSPRTPWQRPNPRKRAGKATKHLTPAEKSAAKARAARAGRSYPNLVDNMAVAAKQGAKTKTGGRKRKASKKTASKKTAKSSTARSTSKPTARKRRRARAATRCANKPRASARRAKGSARWSDGCRTQGVYRRLKDKRG
jgi:hypothetical protein